MKERREYTVKMTVNDHKISKVIIDPHYERRHSKAITDEIILELVKILNGNRFEPDSTDSHFQYFVSDGLWLNGKKYKLVWLLEKNEIYIGVVNAYRR